MTTGRRLLVIQLLPLIVLMVTSLFMIHAQERERTGLPDACETNSTDEEGLVQFPINAESQFVGPDQHGAVNLGGTGVQRTQRIASGEPKPSGDGPSFGDPPEVPRRRIEGSQVTVLEFSRQLENLWLAKQWSAMLRAWLGFNPTDRHEERKKLVVLRAIERDAKHDYELLLADAEHILQNNGRDEAVAYLRREQIRFEGTLLHERILETIKKLAE